MYGIFTYIYQKNHLNVGKYTSPMDPMGKPHLVPEVLTHSSWCWQCHPYRPRVGVEGQAVEDVMAKM